MKKKNNFYLPILIFILVTNVQTNQAQFFKKLKEKISKKTPKVELQVSDTSQVFNGWKPGASDIILYVVTEFDASKRTHVVGSINEDGSFTYKLPDSIQTSVPVNALTEECTHQSDTTIENTQVKISFAKLLVGQNKSFVGNLNPVNPVEAVYNLGENKENNGEKGEYYWFVYSDGYASIQLKCIKNFTMRDAKGRAYKDTLEAESMIAIQLKKGWNLLRTEVIESIPVGAAVHFTKNKVTIVDKLPDDIKWVYQSNKN